MNSHKYYSHAESCSYIFIGLPNLYCSGFCSDRSPFAVASSGHLHFLISPKVAGHKMWTPGGSRSAKRPCKFGGWLENSVHKINAYQGRREDPKKNNVNMVLRSLGIPWMVRLGWGEAGTSHLSSLNGVGRLGKKIGKYFALMSNVWMFRCTILMSPTSNP